MPEALTLDLPELEIAARAWGPAEGRPVLALHGWLDNAASFDELAPRLCQMAGLRIVSLDLPGHGLSQRKRGAYHFVDWVADAAHAADALGWERFSLLGHSMGAGISLLLAGAMPKRIVRCALIEGIGPMVELPERAAHRLGRALRTEANKRASQLRVYPNREDAAARVSAVAVMELSSAQTLVERGLEAAPGGGWVWRADPRLRADSRVRLSEEQVLAFLAAVCCPVRLVAATQGWPIDTKVRQRRLEALTSLSVVELEGHHHLHLDRPQAVADALLPLFGADDA